MFLALRPKSQCSLLKIKIFKIVNEFKILFSKNSQTLQYLAWYSNRRIQCICWGLFSAADGWCGIDFVQKKSLCRFPTVRMFSYLGFLRNITVEVDLQFLDIWDVQLVFLLLLQLVLCWCLNNDLKRKQRSVTVTLLEKSSKLITKNYLFNIVDWMCSPHNRLSEPVSAENTILHS